MSSTYSLGSLGLIMRFTAANFLVCFAFPYIGVSDAFVVPLRPAHHIAVIPLYALLIAVDNLKIN
jgi:hypothetical protein